jgi:hypothetical protein
MPGSKLLSLAEGEKHFSLRRVRRMSSLTRKYPRSRQLKTDKADVL